MFAVVDRLPWCSAPQSNQSRVMLMSVSEQDCVFVLEQRKIWTETRNDLPEITIMLRNFCVEPILGTEVETSQ
jgi:hypothetical protein